PRAGGGGGAAARAAAGGGGGGAPPAGGGVARSAARGGGGGAAPAARCRVVTYGLGPDADVRAEEIDEFGLDGLGFRIVAGGESAAVRTPLLGRHNVSNCLAAAVVALADGMTLAEIAGALATARNELRLKALSGPNGSTLIDDTYNAGPASMAAALDLLA